MRGHTGEHGGYLPVVNVSSIKHVAYVLDALVFYMRETLPISDNETKHKKIKVKGTERNPPSLNIGYCSTDDEENEDSGAASALKNPDLPVRGVFSVYSLMYISLFLALCIDRRRHSEASPSHLSVNLFLAIYET